MERLLPRVTIGLAALFAVASAMLLVAHWDSPGAFGLDTLELRLGFGYLWLVGMVTAAFLYRRELAHEGDEEGGARDRCSRCRRRPAVTQRFCFYCGEPRPADGQD